MRIFFVISRMDRGGAQKVALNLLNHLCKNTDYEVYLILFKRKENDSYLKNLSKECKIINLNKSAKFGWLPLIGKIRNLDPDVVISTINYINIATVVAAIISRTKAKIILREAIPLSTVPYMILSLQRILYWRADHLWAITPVIESELNTLIGIPKIKISLIANPVDIDYIDEVKRNVIEDKRDKQKLRLIYVGRLIKRKGVDSLLKSLSYLHSDNWELKIIGDGSEKLALQELCGELNLLDKIKFISFSENPYDYYFESDLFCLPSWYEGLPNVVIEALVCGNHCLANDTEGGGVRFIKSLVGSIDIVDFSAHEEVAELLSFYINNREDLMSKKNSSLSARDIFSVETIYKESLRGLLES
jgi:glycosyltransferase involved in cell wall biosynthesis